MRAERGVHRDHLGERAEPARGISRDGESRRVGWPNSPAVSLPGKLFGHLVVIPALEKVDLLVPDQVNQPVFLRDRRR